MRLYWSDAQTVRLRSAQPPAAGGLPLDAWTRMDRPQGSAGLCADEHPFSPEEIRRILEAPGTRAQAHGFNSADSVALPASRHRP